MGWEAFNERSGSWVALPHDSVRALNQGLQKRNRPCFIDWMGAEYRCDFDSMRAFDSTNPHKWVQIRNTEASVEPSPFSRDLPSPTHSVSSARSASISGSVAGSYAGSAAAPFGTADNAIDFPERPMGGKAMVYRGPPVASGPKELPVKDVADYIDQHWDEPDGVVDTLKAYIEVPNLSPVFDPEWNTNGFQDEALGLMTDWLERQGFSEGEMNWNIMKDSDRTPTLLIEFPSTLKDQSDPHTVLMYGHFDKQPPFEGWDEGKGPCIPLIIDGKLYGRGGADDGYAMFAAVLAVKALKRIAKTQHPRYVILVEGAEESGSRDLPHYLEKLDEWIGTVEVVICLDSGAGDYERMWLTTSLRGGVNGVLEVHHTKEGVHSGLASGVVPDSFRIMRNLIERVEDSETGMIYAEELIAEIPRAVIDQTELVADAIGADIKTSFPFLPGCQPTTDDPVEMILNATWRAQMATIGASDFPEVAIAGNVLRPKSRLMLSTRLPPTTDPELAFQVLKETFETRPLYNSKVTFTKVKANRGWCAIPAEWLTDSCNKWSEAFYGQSCLQKGEGGSIPFMGMLQRKYPDAQMCVTGVLGPKSNAHGPNEFLHIPFAKKLNGAITGILFTHIAMC